MGPGPGLACDLTLNSILKPALRARFQNQTLIRQALGQTRTIAMVGLSTNRQKASYFVGTYLKYMGFRIIPVHPKADAILGEKAYRSLFDIPEPVDLVDIFRPAPECTAFARQAVEIGAKAFWMQLRIVNEEAAQIAEQGGLIVVMDRCLKMELGRYDGTMHWVGMNTGIITAKRARRWF